MARPTFVVDQKAELIELHHEYSIYDDRGNRIGSVMQVGQSVLTRVLRLLIKADSLLSVKLEIREASGSVALLVHKPAFRITCSVSRPNGALLGGIVPKIRLGKVRMAINDSAGSVFSEIRAENLRAWNFNVQDANGRLIARVDKQWAGARELYTTADKYRVQLDANLTGPCAARWSPPAWLSIRCSSSRSSLIPSEITTEAPAEDAAAHWSVTPVVSRSSPCDPPQPARPGARSSPSAAETAGDRSS